MMLSKYQIPFCFPNLMDVVMSWESCKSAGSDLYM